uniref:Uncharacterized protein n=1 Tax=viral metagenome TaxID=1070528 RepID=A0A6C0C0F1_9ZZZZ
MRSGHVCIIQDCPERKSRDDSEADSDYNALSPDQLVQIPLAWPLFCFSAWKTRINTNPLRTHRGDPKS